MLTPYLAAMALRRLRNALQREELHQAMTNRGVPQGAFSQGGVLPRGSSQRGNCPKGSLSLSRDSEVCGDCVHHAVGLVHRQMANKALFAQVVQHLGEDVEW